VLTYSSATTVSFSRAILLYHQQKASDGKWNAAYICYNFVIFGAAEGSAACLCACIPVTRPFFVKTGQVAMRSFTGISFRALLSKMSLSSQPNQRQYQESVSREISKSDKTTRTVEVDMDSRPLTRSLSANESLNRTDMLSFTENHETPTTGRPCL
jgi:hypothetical protein